MTRDWMFGMGMAVAVALYPNLLFAVAIERAGAALSLLQSRVRVDNIGFWVGAFVAVIGIVLVWRDPTVSQA